MMDIYASRCVKGKYFKDQNWDLTKVKNFLYRKMKNGDWYINANDAVNYGFADKVITSWE
jgi:ATP-dependent protease ClpP protease subunit